MQSEIAVAIPRRASLATSVATSLMQSPTYKENVAVHLPRSQSRATSSRGFSVVEQQEEGNYITVRLPSVAGSRPCSRASSVMDFKPRGDYETGSVYSIPGSNYGGAFSYADLVQAQNGYVPTSNGYGTDAEASYYDDELGYYRNGDYIWDGTEWKHLYDLYYNSSNQNYYPEQAANNYDYNELQDWMQPGTFQSMYPMEYNTDPYYQGNYYHTGGYNWYHAAAAAAAADPNQQQPNGENAVRLDQAIADLGDEHFFHRRDKQDYEDLTEEERQPLLGGHSDVIYADPEAYSSAEHLTKIAADSLPAKYAVSTASSSNAKEQTPKISAAPRFKKKLQFEDSRQDSGVGVDYHPPYYKGLNYANTWQSYDPLHGKPTIIAGPYGEGGRWEDQRVPRYDAHLTAPPSGTDITVDAPPMVRNLTFGREHAGAGTITSTVEDTPPTNERTLLKEIESLKRKMSELEKGSNRGGGAIGKVIEQELEKQKSREKEINEEIERRVKEAEERILRREEEERKRKEEVERERREQEEADHQLQLKLVEQKRKEVEEEIRKLKQAEKERQQEEERRQMQLEVEAATRRARETEEAFQRVKQEMDEERRLFSEKLRLLEDQRAGDQRTGDQRAGDQRTGDQRAEERNGLSTILENEAMDGAIRKKERPNRRKKSISLTPWTAPTSALLNNNNTSSNNSNGNLETLGVEEKKRRSSKNRHKSMPDATLIKHAEHDSNYNDTVPPLVTAPPPPPPPPQQQQSQQQQQERQQPPPKPKGGDSHLKPNKKVSKPLLELNVETRKHGKQQLILQTGQDPRKVALDFCTRFEMLELRDGLTQLVTTAAEERSKKKL